MTDPGSIAADAVPHRSRRAIAIGIVGVIVVGVLSKTVIPGFPGDFLGSASYTALVFLLAAVVAPRVSGAILAGFAFAASAIVELIQLTAFPDAVASVIPLSRWVLGSTFVPTDFLGYAAGAIAAFVVDHLLRARDGRP